MKVSVRVEFEDGVTVDIPVEVTGDDNPRFTMGAFSEGISALTDAIGALIGGLYGTNQSTAGVYSVSPGVKRSA